MNQTDRIRLEITELLRTRVGRFGVISVELLNTPFSEVYDVIVFLIDADNCGRGAMESAAIDLKARPDVRRVLWEMPL